MEAPDLTQMVAELLVAVQLLTGYPAAATTPALEFVPNSKLVEMACEGPCNVRGWYPGGGTIYLDERLDPADDLGARSILAHELVHYLQEQDGAFGVASTCRRWLKREGEAYRVQRQWLQQNRPQNAAPQYLRPNGLRLRCSN